MPHDMVMQRNFVLRSIHGYSVKFVKGEPTSVPTRVVTEAAQMGATMVDPTDSLGADQIEDGEVVETITPSITLSEDDRIAALSAALKGVLDQNNPNHFTAAGYPKVSLVQSMSGVVDARAKEINSMWDDIMKAELGSDDSE